MISCACGDVEAGREAAQARLGTAPAAPDRLLAVAALERQAARSRHGAEQYRVDHSAVVLRQLAHVEQHRALRHLPRCVDDARAVKAAVRHLHLLDGGVDAVDAGDERGAPGRDETVLHRAPGLDQLGGDHHVDVAGARRQREHRLAAAQLVVLRRVDLEVVGGGAGALRDAGNRGALRRVASPGGGIHQPVGHDAAALAAEGGDQDRDRPLGQTHANIPCSEARIPANARSHHDGFCTTSAR
jgi:hypothetical protein